jgi:hypothetical protein
VSLLVSRSWRAHSLDSDDGVRAYGLP